MHAESRKKHHAEPLAIEASQGRVLLLTNSSMCCLSSEVRLSMLEGAEALQPHGYCCGLSPCYCCSLDSSASCMPSHKHNLNFQNTS
jgi:hypothetical protein